MDLMADLHRINQSPQAIRARQIRREARQTVIYDRLAEALNKPSAIRGRTRFAAHVDDAARFASLSKEAAQWNMWDGDEPHEGALLGEQHPGAAALQIVRDAFSEYRIPSEVDLRYRGMKRLSGHGAHGMDDGFVFVQASFSSVSGPKHCVDVPVVVRAGRMLAPSILIHQGIERVITQHTLDDIIGMGEFRQKVPDRLNMYSPPAPERQGAPAREVPIVRPETMYSVLPRRTLTSRLDIQAALRGRRSAEDVRWAKTAAILVQAIEQEMAPENIQYFERLFGKPTKAWGPHEWKEFYRRYDPAQHKVIPAGPSGGGGGVLQKMKQLFLDPMDQDAATQEACPMQATAAGRAIEGRAVQGFYSPQVTRFVENGELGRDVPGADGSDLDPAERPTDDHLWASAPVRTTRAVYVYGRDGARFSIPKGEEGEVVRDVDGCNRAYYVRWYGLGYAATVGRDALKLV